MKFKRKHIVMLAFALLLVLVYSFWLEKDGYELSNEDFIRFHVVANSNSKEDQRLKLMVRDRLMETINEGLVMETMSSATVDGSKAVLDIDRTKEFINKNLAELEGEARSILLGSGCYHTVKAGLGVDYIPQKTYGDITFPAGNYNALKVVIGEGKGENWWCVLFPPLCLIGEAEVVDEDGMKIYKEAIVDDKYKELIEEGKKPKVLKLKFKLLELVKNND